MRRICLAAIVLLLANADAWGDTPALPPRSRILAEILQRYGAGYSELCLVGLAASETFKYARFPLPASFYERFINEQVTSTRINPTGCPLLTGEDDTCWPSCALITIFDMTALGYPTPWSPWANCTQERITFSEGRDRPPGKVVMILNVHREFEVHHHLTVVEIGRCDYVVARDTVIE